MTQLPPGEYRADVIGFVERPDVRGFDVVVGVIDETGVTRIVYDVRPVFDDMLIDFGNEDDE